MRKCCMGAWSSKSSRFDESVLVVDDEEKLSQTNVVFLIEYDVLAIM